MPANNAKTKAFAGMNIPYANMHFKYTSNGGYQLNAGQFQVKPFVVSLSNHERLNRSPFDKLRANG